MICGQVPHGRHRHRCVPGSAGAIDHGRGRQARVPRDRPDASSKPPCAPRSRSRAPAGPGPVVIDVPKDVQNWEGRIHGAGHAADPGLSRSGMNARASATRRRREACAASSRCSAKSKRPLIYAGGGVINGERGRCAARVRRSVRHSGGHDADGHRRVRHHASALRCACSACTARRSPTTRSTIAISCSRSARASTIAWRACRRSSRANAKRIAHIDIDRVRDQQGQARAAGATSGCCAEALRALRAYGKRSRIPAATSRAGTRTSRTLKTHATR